MKCKKLLFFGITLFTILSLTNLSLAANSVDLLGNHKLQIISKDQVPAGIAPKEFESREQALAYVNHLSQEAEYANYVAQITTRIGIVDSVGTESVYATASTAGSKYKDKSQCGGLHYVRIRLDYHYYEENGAKFFTTCDKISSQNLGMTADSSWSQSSSLNRKLDGGRTMEVKVRGTMKHYIIVKELFEVYSEELNFTVEFTP